MHTNLPNGIPQHPGLNDGFPGASIPGNFPGNIPANAIPTAIPNALPCPTAFPG